MGQLGLSNQDMLRLHSPVSLETNLRKGIVKKTLKLEERQLASEQAPFDPHIGLLITWFAWFAEDYGRVFTTLYPAILREPIVKGFWLLLRFGSSQPSTLFSTTSKQLVACQRPPNMCRLYQLPRLVILGAQAGWVQNVEATQKADLDSLSGSWLIEPSNPRLQANLQPH